MTLIDINLPSFHTGRFLDPDKPMPGKWPEVEVEEVNGFYIATSAGEPVDITFVEGLLLDGIWNDLLTNEQIEAGIQIFYDRWNFRSGSDADEKFWKTFEHEKKVRLDNNPSAGSMHYDQEKSVVRVFDGKNWLDLTTGIEG